MTELGANFDHVIGYNGTADTHIAIEAGEVDGRCTTWSTVPASNPSWFETDPPFVTPVVQFTISGRDPRMPDTVSVVELKGQFSELGWNSMLAAMLPLQTYRTYALPPGADSDLVDLYRKAFEEMYSAPDVAESMTAGRGALDATSGAEVEDLLVNQIQVSDAVKNHLIGLLAIE